METAWLAVAQLFRSVTLWKRASTSRRSMASRGRASQSPKHTLKVLAVDPDGPGLAPGVGVHVVLEGLGEGGHVCGPRRALLPGLAPPATLPRSFLGHAPCLVRS